MCRLLYVRSSTPVSIGKHLIRFAETAENSPEDQSHGWGCAWLESDEWRFYHSLKPIWEDDIANFPKAGYFVAHSRSAYRNEGIMIENNMPFTDGDMVFVFNGELKGVRIRERGRIGAEKVFNFVKRFDSGDMLDAVERGVSALVKKTRYVRAMNFVIAGKREAWLNSIYSEYPEYFQMHEKITDSVHIVSSTPYANESGWIPIANHSIRMIE